MFSNAIQQHTYKLSLLVQVLIQFGIHEIPRKHIIKRWTINARDILPPHLEHYQKDKGALHSQTLRHLNLYLSALEVVKLGDSNVKAYEVALKHLMQAKEELQELAAEKDGLALTDQLVVQNQCNNGMQEGNCSADAVDEVNARVSMEKVLPPQRVTKRGRPSVARDKPPYEQRRKQKKYYHTQSMLEAQGTSDNNNTANQCSTKRRLVKCSRCHLLGHNRNTCKAPLPPEYPELNATMW